MACAEPAFVLEMPAWLTAPDGAGATIEALAAAIPSTVFCRGDSICSVCPTLAWLWLTCWLSQLVSNKIERNPILNINVSRKIVISPCVLVIVGTVQVRSFCGRFCQSFTDLATIETEIT